MPKRTGIYIPDELEEKVLNYMKILGLKSKSKLIQEALRSYVIEHEWMSMGRVAGLIGIIYRHDVRGVDDKLTDIQHDYLDIILCHVHVHLSKEKCMLVILVKGDAGRIKKLIEEMHELRGVKLVKPLILSLE